MRWPLAVLLALVAGCPDGGEADLIVQLRTDFAPGIEFARVETALEGEARRVDVARRDPFAAAGRAVGRFDDLSVGRDALVDVRLVDASGETVASRPASVRPRAGLNAVTVTISRSCEGVTCPGAAAPAATACLGGVCVDPACLTGREPSCPPPACDAPTGCSVDSACARALCADGVCLQEPNDSACRAGEACVPSEGCVVAPAPMDGGATDAGTLDAGISDVGPPDADPPDAGRPERVVLRWPPLAHVTPSRRPRLIWEPVPLADRYDVQLSSGCEVETFRDCELEDPVDREAATNVFEPADELPVDTAPAGRRYFWRARACDTVACGPWSEVRYLDVGRAVADFDGDGAGDLGVGAPDHDLLLPDAGSVTTFLQRLELIRADGGAFDTGQAYGAAVAWVGDTNADGYQDMVVGAPGAMSARGQIRFAGGAPGVEFPGVAILVDGATARDALGTSVAGLGDVDGDGYSDFAVGAPGANVTGRVQIHRGGPGGIDREPWLTLDAPMGSLFGTVVAGLGDVDGDGLGDLAATVPALDPFGSAVCFYLSGGLPIDGTDPDCRTRADEGDPAHSVAAGDLDGDGFDDVVACTGGLPRTAEVLMGSRGGLVDGGTLTGDGRDTALCASSAVGDFDGDGEAEILIGDPTGGPMGVGTLHVWQGDERGEASIVLPPPEALEGGGFGTAIALIDIEGDGRPDVFVGAPFATVTLLEQGAVARYEDLPRVAPSVIVSDRAESGAHFGAAFAR